MKKYIKSSLVDTPQEVIDELIDILGEYGFILDPVFKTNPGRTWMSNVHMQVIMPDTYIEDFEEIEDYVPREMIDDIDELENRSNCPITWNFGANKDHQLTGGLDIHKQWIEDDVLSSSEVDKITTNDLSTVRRNAKQKAHRDGYDQVIIRDRDGKYSFSRKYDGCCPDWYGEIVEVIKAR